MAMYFREHRGSFEASMETIREIQSVTELGNVTVKDYGFDKRLNSPSKLVLEDGMPIGYITGKDKVVKKR